MSMPSAKTPEFEDRIRDSFGRQPFMRVLGAEITRVAPGHVTVELSHRLDLTQQHGVFHGGVIGTMADVAAAYAAYTLLPADCTIVTAEYKLNLVAPGLGETLIAHGDVAKAGRTLTVCRAEVLARRGDTETVCALGLFTIMTRGRPDIAHPKA